LREAARVSSATHETSAEVIPRASKGVLSLATLKSLGESEVAAARSVLSELERMAVGCAVTVKCRTRRRSWASTRKTYRIWNRIVVTVK
jgi:hypothetical protein